MCVAQDTPHVGVYKSFHACACCHRRHGELGQSPARVSVLCPPVFMLLRRFGDVRGAADVDCSSTRLVACLTDS